MLILCGMHTMRCHISRLLILSRCVLCVMCYRGRVHLAFQRVPRIFSGRAGSNHREPTSAQCEIQHFLYQFISIDAHAGQWDAQACHHTLPKLALYSALRERGRGGATTAEALQQPPLLMGSAGMGRCVYQKQVASDSAVHCAGGEV
jgi:hypothetical protein